MSQTGHCCTIALLLSSLVVSAVGPASARRAYSYGGSSPSPRAYVSRSSSSSESVVRKQVTQPKKVAHAKVAAGTEVNEKNLSVLNVFAAAPVVSERSKTAHKSDDKTVVASAKSVKMPLEKK